MRKQVEVVAEASCGSTVLSRSQMNRKASTRDQTRRCPKIDSDKIFKIKQHIARADMPSVSSIKHPLTQKHSEIETARIMQTKPVSV